MSYGMNGWNKEIPGGDTISRAAAIDAILHNQEVYSNNFGNDPIDRYTIAIIDADAQAIAQLPSAQPDNSYSDGFADGYKRGLIDAQPEIVRCKDCKYNQLPATSGNANCEIYYGMTDQDGFCHMAERRTDDQT